MSCEKTHLNQEVIGSHPHCPLESTKSLLYNFSISLNWRCSKILVKTFVSIVSRLMTNLTSLFEHVKHFFQFFLCSNRLLWYCWRLCKHCRIIRSNLCCDSSWNKTSFIWREWLRVWFQLLSFARRINCLRSRTWAFLQENTRVIAMQYAKNFKKLKQGRMKGHGNEHLVIRA